MHKLADSSLFSNDNLSYKSYTFCVRFWQLTNVPCLATPSDIKGLWKRRKQNECFRSDWSRLLPLFTVEHRQCIVQLTLHVLPGERAGPFHQRKEARLVGWWVRCPQHFTSYLIVMSVGHNCTFSHPTVSLCEPERIVCQVRKSRQWVLLSHIFP